MMSKSEQHSECKFEVCAWCGKVLEDGYWEVGEDHICQECMGNHLREKRRTNLLKKGVKHG